MVEACESVSDNLERLAALANAYYSAGLYRERRYVHNLAVHSYVLVENDLAGSSTCGSNTQTVYHVVQTRFQKLEQDFTGDTFEARCFLEEVAELAFEQTVGIFGFLLFAKLYAVFRCFATLVLSVLARGEVATGENLVFAEYLRAILVLGPVYLAIVVEISLSPDGGVSQFRRQCIVGAAATIER